MRLAIDDPTTDEPELSPGAFAARQAFSRAYDVGRLIAEARLARRMPVRRLAAVTGISARVIEDIEVGTATDVGRMILVAEAVGLDFMTAMRKAAEASPPIAEEFDDEALPAPGD